MTRINGNDRVKKQMLFNKNNGMVIACIPYYQCQRYIRRAVESLLAQTYKHLTVVVINDADFETPPWPMLADIDDPRLVRYDLYQNRGPYFATQIALKATTASFMLIQDADDWSHPDRVSYLLSALEQEKADLAISAQPQFYESSDGSNNISNIRWLTKANNNAVASDIRSRYVLDTKLTSKYLYRSPHHGLFRVKTLREIGGYYGGFRFNYDVLITNIILMIGKIAHVSEPLYYRLVRPMSLTQAPDTGIQSVQRNYITSKTSALYESLYPFYIAFLKAQITGAEMLSIIRRRCEAQIGPEDRQAIFFESEMLKKQIRLQSFN